MTKVKWSELKKYSDDLSFPIIWVERNSNGLKVYDLSLSHKSLAWICTLTEGSDDSEITEFETDYKGEIIELKISQNINLLTEIADTYTPPNGSNVIIIGFSAEAPYDLNTVCKLIWDYNEAGETVLWSTQGSGKAPFKPIITDTDGSKELAITCDNGTLGTILMSAYAKVLVING